MSPDPAANSATIDVRARRGNTKPKDSFNPASSYKNELERIQDYDAGFKSIFEATQINDIDALIEQFEKAENNNYSLLKYAESLSADIKELDEEISELEKNGINKEENNRDEQFK